MSKKIILLAGPSGTGKTSVADALEKKGYSVLKSYTTREKRKEDDNDHVYISVGEFAVMEDDMVAKTKFNGNFYGATNAQVEESDVYVIDVKGIRYFLEKYSGEKKPVVFYLNTDENTRFCRMILRGDGYEKVMSRIYHDREAFSKVFVEESCPDKVEIDASMLQPWQIAEIILKKTERM